MKFNIELPEWLKESLEEEYKEYVKVTPMTPKERLAVREWVKNGNSVHSNPEDAWQDGMIPVDFLDTYRDTEYILEHTKGMNNEKRAKFAMAYYGWDEPDDTIPDSNFEPLTEVTGNPFI